LSTSEYSIRSCMSVVGLGSLSHLRGTNFGIGGKKRKGGTIV